MSSNWLVRVVLALGVAISPSVAQDAKHYTYLALGDSIPFGFDPTLFQTGVPAPSDFIGYPEIVATFKHKELHVNAACPGETSGSFLSLSAPDNGCNGFGPQGQPPFKTFIGLHAAYLGTQIEFAKNQLLSNKQIKTVTLSIGGNDLSLLQVFCSRPGIVFTDCVAENLPGVLANYGTNLSTILNELRRGSKYSGELVLMTNYAPNTNPLFTYAVHQLNETMVKVGQAFDAKFADGFGAFQLASAMFGGDPCAAGLLIRLPAPGGPNGACDIHPSAMGRDLLAASVLVAKKKL